MMAWLEAQAQKQELTTTKIQQNRLGINLNEQLSAKQKPVDKVNKKEKKKN